MWPLQTKCLPDPMSDIHDLNPEFVIHNLSRFLTFLILSFLKNGAKKASLAGL